MAPPQTTSYDETRKWELGTHPRHYRSVTFPVCVIHAGTDALDCPLSLLIGHMLCPLFLFILIQ